MRRRIHRSDPAGLALLPRPPPEEALEPGAEEARPETEDGEEAGEEGERELDGEGDEPQAEEAAED